MRYLLLAVLVLVAMCSICVAELDVTADVHLHTNKRLGGFSDGALPPVLVFNNSISRVVVFTDHLDGVVEKGTNRYLSTIRGLTNAKKLAIPGVEVTCGLSESSYDMLVLGLNNESLAELASLYKRGAFVYCENGLPALKAVADRYDLVLLAAHPDNSKIPFSLAENAKFCDGFELFDSNHVGYSTNDLAGNLAKFYENGASKVTLPSGIDFHFGPTGAVPTKSLLEVPVTHVLLDNDTEVNEANVVESIRGGRIYATSWLGARITGASCTPGGVWNPVVRDQLLLVCTGIPEGSLLEEYFGVIVSNGRVTKLLKFRPIFKDGRAIMAITFAALELPDATVCNVNFGGRLVTSTIKISPPKAQPVVAQTKGEVTIWANGATPKVPVSGDEESMPSWLVRLPIPSTYTGERDLGGVKVSARLVFKSQLVARLTISYSKGSYRGGSCEALDMPNGNLPSYSRDVIFHCEPTANYLPCNMERKGGRKGVDDAFAVALKARDYPTRINYWGLELEDGYGGLQHEYLVGFRITAAKNGVNGKLIERYGTEGNFFIDLQLTQ